MQDRRAFLSRSLAFAATLPAVAAALSGPGPARSDPAARPGTADGMIPGRIPDIATLDVRPLGNGLFLVSGWVLTAADLGALGHAA